MWFWVLKLTRVLLLLCGFTSCEASLHHFSLSTIIQRGLNSRQPGLSKTNRTLTLFWNKLWIYCNCEEAAVKYFWRWSWNGSLPFYQYVFITFSSSSGDNRISNINTITSQLTNYLQSETYFTTGSASCSCFPTTHSNSHVYLLTLVLNNHLLRRLTFQLVQLHVRTCFPSTTRLYTYTCKGLSIYYAMRDGEGSPIYCNITWGVSSMFITILLTPSL